MTDKTMLDDLTKVAAQFRQMIENTDRAKLPDEFENFPGWAPGSRDDEKIHAFHSEPPDH